MALLCSLTLKLEEEGRGLSVREEDDSSVEDKAEGLFSYQKKFEQNYLEIFIILAKCTTARISKIYY